MHARTKTIAIAALAPALVTGGLALARGGDDNGSGNGKSNGRAGHRAHHPPGGPGMRNLTWAELHVRRSGDEVTLRLDRGKVVSADADSIKLKENDGNEVTIPLADNAKVHAGPGRDLKVADLKEGRLVTVIRDDGKPAKDVMVMPKRGQRPPHGRFGGPPGEGPPPPPPADGDQG